MARTLTSRCRRRGRERLRRRPLENPRGRPSSSSELVQRTLESCQNSEHKIIHSNARDPKTVFWKSKSNLLCRNIPTYTFHSCLLRYGTVVISLRLILNYVDGWLRNSHRLSIESVSQLYFTLWELYSIVKKIGLPNIYEVTLPTFPAIPSLRTVGA